MHENTHRPVLNRVVALLASLAWVGCSSGSTATTEATERTRPTQLAGTLATVNGKPITSSDVRLASQARVGAHGEGEQAPAGAEPDRNVLETLIRDELVAQRAEAMHLDRDPEYQAELTTRQAQIDAFRRRRLGELYEQHERQTTDVTDAEARQYFDANAARLRTEVHIWQILVRDERRIEQAHREIAAGTPFEQVARGLYPTMPADQAPWDLGFLRWNLVPDAWRSVVYGMSPGQTSGVIRGARNRFWIIRLVEKRENASVTFENSRATIVQLLREERLHTARTRAGDELRRGARIVYSRRAESPQN